MNQDRRGLTRELDGVYYSPDDYAGLGRRLLILLIDGAVLFLAIAAMVGTYASVAPALGYPFQVYAGAVVLVIFGYLAILGRSRWGTVGYALTSVRVVNLRGEQPSVPCMLFRTLFAVLGPLDAVFNVIWLGGDPHRQSVHDKLAATYVVRRGVEPAGHGRQGYVTYTLFGYTFMVREVSRGVT